MIIFRIYKESQRSYEKTTVSNVIALVIYLLHNSITLKLCSYETTHMYHLIIFVGQESGWGVTVCHWPGIPHKAAVHTWLLFLNKFISHKFNDIFFHFNWDWWNFFGHYEEYHKYHCSQEGLTKTNCDFPTSVKNNLQKGLLPEPIKDWFSNCSHSHERILWTKSRCSCILVFLIAFLQPSLCKHIMGVYLVLHFLKLLSRKEGIK